MITSLENFIKPNPQKFLSDILSCNICKGILIKPLLCTSCEKFFCKNCLFEWHRENATLCPNNCKETNFIQDKTIESFLKEINFKCNNGCNDIIPYNEYEEHYNSKCSKINYENLFTKKLKELERSRNNIDKLKEENQKLLDELTKDDKKVSIEDNFYITIYHPHPLKSVYSYNKCSVCENSDGGGYSCNKCQFNYCKWCKICEDKQNFPILDD